MAILKIEVNTDDIFSGDPEEGYGAVSFETLIKGAINEKVKEGMQKKFSEEAFKKVSKNITLECIYQVEKKLHNLVNEDIIIQSRWGAPKFIGSVEDYIKQEIDARMLQPVDSGGKPLTGACSQDNTTWIEWKVKKKIDYALKDVERHLDSFANQYIKRELDNRIETFKQDGLNKLIIERLEAAGITGR